MKLNKYGTLHGIQIWYAEQEQAQISKVNVSKSVSVDLKTSILKPIHVKW